MDEAVESRSCQLFTVLGAAGVGKSRLAHAFLSGLEDVRVVRGTCLSYGEGITYWPVVEVLKQLLGFDAAARLASLEVEESSSQAIRGVLGEPGFAASVDEIAWATRRVLEAAAEESPLVVVLDDVHWGEEAFLDLVDHIADLSRDAPILLFCMARPELLDRRPTWAAASSTRRRCCSSRSRSATPTNSSHGCSTASRTTRRFVTESSRRPKAIRSSSKRWWRSWRTRRVRP